MNKYTTFGNIELDNINPAYVENVLGITLATNDPVPTPFPDIRSSTCSCQKNVNITHDAIHFKQVTVDQITSDQKCIVCQDLLIPNLNTENPFVSSFRCGHVFHFKCITKWLAKCSVCPICALEWEYVTEAVSENKIVVDFGDNRLKYEYCPDTKFEEYFKIIFDDFGLDSKHYKLTKNGKEITAFTPGCYAICSADMHSHFCVEIVIVNGFSQSENPIPVEQKMFVKHSTKIPDFKSSVASMLGTICDKIKFMFQGIDLTSDMDELNLFNIGIESGSRVIVVKKTDIKYYLDINEAEKFVVCYTKSNTFVQDSSLQNILIGRCSWYPSAYQSVSDPEMCAFLAALYIFAEKIGTDATNISQAIKTFENYLNLYKLYHHVIKEALEYLLTRSGEKFTDLHRTCLCIGVHDLIFAIKSHAHCGDNKYLIESNIFFGILYAESMSTAPSNGTLDYLDWVYAKKNISVQKIFTINSPLMLSRVEIPALTLDTNFNIAIYHSKGKDVALDVTIYQPLTNSITPVNPAMLGKKMSENNITLVDERIYEEAIMVCIDTSNSMDSCSDFDEDTAAQQKLKSAATQQHYAIWNDTETLGNLPISPEEIRLLKNAVIWFLTHPNLKHWSKKMGSLRQIVCYENKKNPEIALQISRYRNVFQKLLRGDSVEISGKIYGNNAEPVLPREIDVPNEFLCPISYELMENPVILDDGHTYERDAIITWLKKNKKSPITGLDVAGDLTPNYAIKSLICNRKKTHKKDTNPNTQLPYSIRIIRESDDDLYYHFGSMDENVYDLKYYLHNTLKLSSNKYQLIGTEGYPASNLRLLTNTKQIVLRVLDNKVVKLKLVDGFTEKNYFDSNVTIMNVSCVCPADYIVYAFGKYDYDLVEIFTNFKEDGDRMYRGKLLESFSAICEDMTMHIFPGSIRLENQTSYFSRLDVVKKLFGAYIDRSIAYNPNTVIGLMSFSDTSKVVCPLTPYYEVFRDEMDNLDVSGGTALYNCLSQATDELQKWRALDLERRSCTKLRIICLTDGNDSTNFPTQKIQAIKNVFNDNKVTLDCIFIGNEYDRDLISIAKMNNGYTFNPKSIENAYKIVELETMISSINRLKINRQSILETNYVPPMEQPVIFKKTFESITTLSGSNLTFCPMLSNPRRLKIEIEQLAQNCHPDIDIYVSRSNCTFLQMIISGPIGTPYTGGTWLVSVQIPTNYPFGVPEIRFVTTIKHCNINDYGRICHSILNRNYLPNVSLGTIFQCIYGLLLNPDIEDPLDNNLAMSYYESDGQYEASIMEHVKIYAAKTRKEWHDELI